VLSPRDHVHMTGPIRAVLAGAGYWGEHAHLPALLSNPEVRVTAVVDPDIDRAERLSSAYGVPRFARSLDGLLDAADLAVLATPTESHHALAEQCLAAGVAVLCEKPIANTVETARRMAAAAADASTAASVGYSFRYGPGMQALKLDIVNGSLGDPWLLEMFEYNAQFHPAKGKPLNWKGDPSLARAGALLEYGAHLIDMAAWLAGPIQAVHASTTRVLPNARLDDIATLQVRFASPAIGVLVSGWVLTGSVPGIKIRFHGSAGLAEVEMNHSLPGGQAYRRYTLDGDAREIPLQPLVDPMFGYAARHVADLVARVQGAPSPFPHTMPDFADGVAVQEVLEAALSATGGWASPDSVEPSRVED
jgi:predicted dehydrogenase